MYQSLKCNVSLDPWKTFSGQIIVRMDTGVDVNCMNEKTFHALFPEVKLSWCPHQIQNFENSAEDIQILGESQIFLLFKGVKYLHTFIVTNANDCPNVLSHAATFRMGVLEPQYPQHMQVEGENVAHFISSKNESSPPGKLITCNVMQIIDKIQSKNAVKSLSSRNTTPSKREPKMMTITMNMNNLTIKSNQEHITLQQTSAERIHLRVDPS